MNPRIAILVLAASAAPAVAQSCGRWEVVPSPNPPQADRVILNGITAITPDDAWAVGEWSGFVDGDYQNFGLAMHWDGQSWSIVETPQPAPCNACHYVALNAVDATGPNDVWAAGGQRIQAPDGFVGTHILVMRWDGKSWKVMDTPVQIGASGDFIWDVQALAPDDVWFFGENLYSGEPLLLDLAIAMHWDGSSFEFVEVPIVNFKAIGFGDGNSLRAGSALSPDDIWAVGAGGDGDDLSCDLSQIHHWDGSRWNHVPAQAPDGCFWHSLNAVHAVAPGDVWAGGETFDGDYHSLSLHWTGQSWAEEPMPIAVSDFISFGPDVYAIGSGVARRQGGAWAVVESFDGVTGPNLTSADEAGDCAAWAAGRQLVGEDFALRSLTARLVPGHVCSPDLDGNGALDLFDFLAFTNLFNAHDPGADWDQNGVFDLFDFLGYVNAFNAGC